MQVRPEEGCPVSWTHPGEVRGGPAAARGCPTGARGLDAEQAVKLRICRMLFFKKT